MSSVRAPVELRNSNAHDGGRPEVTEKRCMNFKLSSFAFAALIILVLWASQSFSQAEVPPGKSIASDMSACSTAVTSASDINVSALFQGAASCAREHRQEDTNFLMTIGEIRAKADLTVLTPLDDTNARMAVDLYIKLRNHIAPYKLGSFGFDEFYRTPANVSVLEERIRGTDLLFSDDYDPGWAYAPSSKTDIYLDILSNAREQRIWQMRNMALKLQNDRYYEAYQALMALQKTYPHLQAGTPTYEEFFRLRAQMRDAARDIPELPQPEDTIPYARLNEQDPELSQRQVAVGFNGPPSQGAHIFRSEAEVRQSWLSVALSGQELEKLISGTDFSTQVLVGFSFGKRMNASGQLMISELGYHENLGGYTIATRIGVVSESCGYSFTESYPFVVGIVDAVTGGEVRGHSSTNFADECRPIVSGEPATR
jgi:hypothetical protein